MRWSGCSDLVPALLAQLAARLGGRVGQAAAGRRRLLVPVPLPVPEPGEGHAGGDGGHGLGGGHVAPGLLQQFGGAPAEEGQQE